MALDFEGEFVKIEMMNKVQVLKLIGQAEDKGKKTKVLNLAYNSLQRMAF